MSSYFSLACLAQIESAYVIIHFFIIFLKVFKIKRKKERKKKQFYINMIYCLKLIMKKQLYINTTYEKKFKSVIWKKEKNELFQVWYVKVKKKVNKKKSKYIINKKIKKKKKKKKKKKNKKYFIKKKKKKKKKKGIEKC